MRIEILNDANERINTIVADEAFAEARYPGKWRLAAVQAAAEAISMRITTLAFINRFTDQEWADLDIASLDLATDGLVARRARARLRRFLLKIQTVRDIDLQHPEWVAGVQAIEAAGIIAAGRAATILTTPTAPDELP